MRWQPTKGRKPRTKEKLLVRFRNGIEGGPYTADQLVWGDRQDDWDIVEVARA